jgi:hypothetical protein
VEQALHLEEEVYHLVDGAEVWESHPSEEVYHLMEVWESRTSVSLGLCQTMKQRMRQRSAN